MSKITDRLLKRLRKDFPELRIPQAAILKRIDDDGLSWVLEFDSKVYVSTHNMTLCVKAGKLKIVPIEKLEDCYYIEVV